MGFPDGSDGKEFACNAGELGLIPGLGRFPGGGHGNPFQYSCLENPRGQRSLVGYSPRGRRESDTTERLSTHTQERFQFWFNIFLKKKIYFINITEIMLFGIYPNELKNYVHTKTCMWLSIEALFIIVKTSRGRWPRRQSRKTLSSPPPTGITANAWKQPRSPR